jgi:hypothetical protein
MSLPVTSQDPTSPTHPTASPPKAAPFSLQIKNPKSTIINHQSKELPCHEHPPEISLTTHPLTPKPLRFTGAWGMDLRLMIVEF